MILGPTGGVLVLEVKGGELRKLSTTGRWEGADRDHPLTQLLAEWHAIILRLQETADGNAVPFVAKALCLAGLTIDPKIPAYKEIERNLIVDRGDLAAFETTWGRLFARRGDPVPEEERKVSLIPVRKTSRRRRSNISLPRPIGSSCGKRRLSIRFWTSSAITGNLSCRAVQAPERPG